MQIAPIYLRRYFYHDILLQILYLLFFYNRALKIQGIIKSSRFVIFSIVTGQ